MFNDVTTRGFLVELHVESAGDFWLDVAVVRRRNLFLFTVDEAQRPVSVDGSRGCERVLFTTKGVACNVASTWNFCGKLRKVARWSVREIAPGKLLKQFAAVRHASKFSCAFFFSFLTQKLHLVFFIARRICEHEAFRFVSLFVCAFTRLPETISNFLW